MPNVRSMRQKTVMVQRMRVPPLMWYTNWSVASGTVSPRCMIMRMACTSGVKNSCPLGLNSSLPHLHNSAVLTQNI